MHAMKIMGSCMRVIARCLDAIAPRQSRDVRIESYSLNDIPIAPQSHELLGTHVTTIMDYRAQTVQDLVRSLKYDGSLYAASLAAQALTDFLREEIASGKMFSPRKTLIVPIPLHVSRRRERGYNQIEIILHRIPAEFQDGRLASLSTDLLARMLAKKLGEALGQQVLVENRTGAGGTIGNAVAAKAAPDGYTLLLGTVSTLAISPSAYATPPYDPMKAFAPVSLLTNAYFTIGANAAGAKAAVMGLTTAAALELAPYGITVNCLLPSALTQLFPMEASRRRFGGIHWNGSLHIDRKSRVVILLRHLFIEILHHLRHR